MRWISFLVRRTSIAPALTNLRHTSRSRRHRPSIKFHESHKLEACAAFTRHPEHTAQVRAMAGRGYWLEEQTTRRVAGD